MNRSLGAWRALLRDQRPLSDADLDQMVADEIEGSDLTYCVTAEAAGAMADPIGAYAEGTDFTDLLRRVLKTYAAVLGVSPARILFDLQNETAPGAKSIRSLFSLVLGLDPDEVPAHPTNDPND